MVSFVGKEGDGDQCMVLSSLDVSGLCMQRKDACLRCRLLLHAKYSMSQKIQEHGTFPKL